MDATTSTAGAAAALGLVVFAALVGAVRPEVTSTAAPYLAAQTTNLWQKPNAVDGSVGSTFGSSLALSGGVLAASGTAPLAAGVKAFVSVYGDTEPSTAAGNWQYGLAIGLDDDSAAVTALSVSGGVLVVGQAQLSVVSVFVRQPRVVDISGHSVVDPASPWRQAASQLTTSSVGSDARFGWAVAMGDGVVAVGAPGPSQADVDSGSSAASRGQVLMFASFGSLTGAWSQFLGDALVSPHSNETDADMFGEALHFDGYLLVVGAPGESYNSSLLDVGAVHVRSPRRAVGVFAVLPRLCYVVHSQIFLPSALETEAAGGSVMGDGPTDVRLGLTHVERIQLDAPAAGDRFGHAVSSAVGLIFVSAVGYDDVEHGDDIGAVFVYRQEAWDRSDFASFHVRLVDVLIARDARPDLQFGGALAASAALLVVGTPHDDVSGIGSGSVALFTQQTPEQTDSLWMQLGETIYDLDGEAGDAFGAAVAVDGVALAVAAPEKDDIGIDSGAVYVVMSQRIAVGVAETRFVSSQDSMTFGTAIHVHEHVAAVGDPTDETFGTEAGLSAVFAITDSAWSEIAVLASSNAEAYDRLGTSVLVLSTAPDIVVVVGAPSVVDVGAATSGKLLLFRVSNTDPGDSVPVQTEEAVITDSSSRTGFGFALAGTNGAFACTTRNADLGGGVTVFSGSGTSWSAAATFGPTETAAEDARVGASVAMATVSAGVWVAVGASWETDATDNVVRRGAAWVFAAPDAQSEWVEVTRLLPPDGGGASGLFGASVAVANDIVFVGSPGDAGAGTDMGSVWMFSPEDPLDPTAIWLPVGWKLVETGSVTQRAFGLTLSAHNGVLVVGAPCVDGSCPGSAFIFAPPDPELPAAENWLRIAELVAPTQHDADRFGAQVSAYVGDGIADPKVVLVAAVPEIVDESAQGGSGTRRRLSGPQHEPLGAAVLVFDIERAVPVRPMCSAPDDRDCIESFPRSGASDGLRRLALASLAASWYDEVRVTRPVRVASRNSFTVNPRRIRALKVFVVADMDAPSENAPHVLMPAEWEPPGSPFTTMELDGLTLDTLNITEHADGGILRVTAAGGPGTLVLRHCTLAGGSAARGGAVFASGTGVSLSLYDSALHGNEALAGGALYATNQASVAVFDSTVANNEATLLAGAGVFVDGGSRLQLHGCELSGNVVHGDGGALYVGLTGSALVNDTLFSGNSALTGSGGASYVAPGAIDVSFDGAVIEDCDATVAGGGIALQSSDVAMRSSVVRGCAAADGGGIWLNSGASLRLNETGLINNIAHSQGGGIGCYTKSYLDVVDADIVDNAAAQAGGGLFLSDCQSKVNGDTTVSGNAVTEPLPASILVGGGGMAVFATDSNDASWGNTVVQSALFDGNSALNGGSMLLVADPWCSIGQQSALACSERPEPAPEASWITLGTAIAFSSGEADRGRDVLWVHRAPSGLQRLPPETDVASGPVRLRLNNSEGAPLRTVTAHALPEVSAVLVDIYDKESLAEMSAVVTVTSTVAPAGLTEAVADRVTGGSAVVSGATVTFDSLVVHAAELSSGAGSRPPSELQFTLAPDSGVLPLTHPLVLEGCPAGFEPVAIEGGTACEKCPPGKFQDQENNWDACNDAGVGTFSDEAGSEHPTECPVGTFGVVVGAKSSADCGTCPKGTTTRGKAASSPDDCVSLAGHFLDAYSDGTLVKCTDGMNCTEPGVYLDTLPMEAGYWRATLHDTDVRECETPEYCVGGVGAGLEGFEGAQSPLCVEGHGGPLCAACIPGWGHSAGPGSPCQFCNGQEPDNERALVALVIGCTVLALLIVCFMQFVDHRSRVKVAKRKRRAASRAHAAGAATDTGQLGPASDRYRTQRAAKAAANAAGMATVSRIAARSTEYSMAEDGVDGEAAAENVDAIAAVAVERAEAIMGLAEGLPDMSEQAQQALDRAKELAGSTIGLKLKQLLGFFHISLSLPATFPRVSFPPEFESFAARLSVLTQLDVFSLTTPSSCAARTDHYGQLSAFTIAPVVVVVFVVVFAKIGECLAICCWRRRRNRVHSPRSLEQLHYHVPKSGDGWRLAVAINLFLVFTVYPGVSAKILQTFNCEEFANGEQFLAVDYDVSCDSAERSYWLVYAALAAVVYPLGCVLLFVGVLWSNIDVVNPVRRYRARSCWRVMWHGSVVKTDSKEEVDEMLSDAERRVQVHKALLLREKRRKEIDHLSFLWEACVVRSTRLISSTNAWIARGAVTSRRCGTGRASNWFVSLP